MKRLVVLTMVLAFIFFIPVFTYAGDQPSGKPFQALQQQNDQLKMQRTVHGTVAEDGTILGGSGDWTVSCGCIPIYCLCTIELNTPFVKYPTCIANQLGNSYVHDERLRIQSYPDMPDLLEIFLWDQTPAGEHALQFGFTFMCVE